MPYKRDTPQEILRRVEADMASASPNGDVKLRRSVEAVFARAIAMVAHLIYGFLDWIAKQILPDTADDEILIRHSHIWSLTQKAATAATGSVTFTGTNGATVIAGTVLQRVDEVSYILDADVTIVDGEGTGSVTAVEPGANGNAEAGTKLTMTSPVAGIQSEATVSENGLTLGVDIESIEQLRQRLLERIQNPPQGGSAYDYVLWAKEVAGVTRAWAYPEQYGRGTVGLTFVMDDAEDIIPGAPEVEQVQNYLEIARPTSADVTVFAPTPAAIDFEIHIRPNSVAVQNAIKAEIEDLFQREAEPGGILYISRIREAISIAIGEFDHVLVSPAANVEMEFGELAVVGTFTWETLA